MLGSAPKPVKQRRIICQDSLEMSPRRSGSIRVPRESERGVGACSNGCRFDSKPRLGSNCSNRGVLAALHADLVENGLRNDDLVAQEPKQGRRLIRERKMSGEV